MIPFFHSKLNSKTLFFIKLTQYQQKPLKLTIINYNTTKSFIISNKFNISSILTSTHLIFIFLFNILPFILLAQFLIPQFSPFKSFAVSLIFWIDFSNPPKKYLGNKVFITDEQKIQVRLAKTMISYKIITQELYDNLAKLSLDIPSQKAFLIQSNTQLISKVQQFQAQVTILELQLKGETQKNHELLSQITHLQSKLDKMSQKLAFETGNKQLMAKQNNETALLLENALKHKTQIMAQNSELINRLSVLQSGIITLNQKNVSFQEKQKLLQSRIQQMKSTINTENAQKQNLLNKLHQKQQTLENVNFQLNKNAEILEKVLGQYEGCKEEKLGLEAELQKFKESPIPKLQQKITANETWIVELTKTINQLRQRCVELQMDRPSYQVNAVPSLPYYSKTPFYLRPSAPYSPPVVAPYIPKLSTHNEKVQQAVPNTTEQTFFTQKSRFEETQRLKYLTICKQLVHQFNAKLSKIQQQKKSMQEKFQSLKLKLNEYQYNEFKYKDRISLYLQKIKRYEKLTEKQQSEMENLILEFDQELNNVVRMKEEEVRSKLEEEVSKYQIQLQRLKEQEELTKKLQEQAYEELIKHETICDSFDHEMLKQSLEQTGNQLAQKSAELESVRNELNKKTKELLKYKESKQSYKQKALTLEQECHDNSTEIRRLKGLIQELIQELQTKSNENNQLKSTLQNRESHLTNRSNEDSRLRYGEEFNENLSGNISLNKNVNAGKRSGSERFEYQFSQIDVELQRRNDLFLNQIVMKTRQEFQNFVSNNAAGPSRVSQHSDQVPNSQLYWTRGLKPSIKDSMDSINKSQISSQQENEENKEKEINSGTNSPNSSVSSKNSYQSYGMRSLYKQKTNTVQNWGHRFLQHKNSLQ